MLAIGRLVHTEQLYHRSGHVEAGTGAWGGSLSPSPFGVNLTAVIIQLLLVGTLR